LGFRHEHLSARVGELSGGQKRRLQILLVLLDQPNVMILDEPTNDVDADMLTALEDVLDTWPGTLLVVSHDRYLIERVTDQQYAIIDGSFRHLPGGVEQYLKIQSQAELTEPSPAEEETENSGARAYAAQKELSALERKMDRLTRQDEDLKAQMAGHDPTDYVGLQDLADQVRAVEDEVGQLEAQWLELSEELEG
ncbi:MAG: ATP-binding cassette domain-containing protein, partial [Actinomyces sp.]|nr:ATP-binding cassette domain-containing protein [Actinomyces sp.]